MALVKGPLMSMDASGKLANAIVFAKWKGRNYVRGLVVPANPKSAKQLSVRAMMKWLSQEWNALGAVQKATWDDIADAEVISPFNAYVSANMKRWANFQAPSDRTPVTEGGTYAVAGARTSTGGLLMATINCPVTTVNNGWGCCIFRSATTGFTPGFANLVQVVNQLATGDEIWVDTPKAAGTYYYNYRDFTLYGKLRPAWGETSATIVAA